jgi:hypothetical protein
MSDFNDLDAIFDRAAPAPSGPHRERVWEAVLAAAQPEAESSSSTYDPNEITNTGTMPALAPVVPMKPRRRPLYAALAAVAAVVVLIGGFVATRRNGRVITEPADQVTTTSARSTSTSPRRNPVTIDAKQLLASAPVDVTTFGPIAVGDFAYGLDRTPDGEIYFAGFDGFDATTFRVDTFNEKTGTATRYELPASFLKKLADGSMKYRGWTLGPSRILYGYEYQTASGPAVNVVAVPTELKRVSQVVAKEAVPPGATCERAPDGIRCGGKLVRSWVTNEGTTLGKTFDGDWYKFADAHKLTTEAASPATPAIDSGVDVTLPSGTVVTFTNLYAAFGSSQPAGLATQTGEFTNRECAFARVAYEGAGTTFVVCVDRSGGVRSSSYAALTGSLPGGSVELLTDGAFYTVRQTDTGSVLVKYPIG